MDLIFVGMCFLRIFLTLDTLYLNREGCLLNYLKFHQFFRLGRSQNDQMNLQICLNW